MGFLDFSQKHPAAPKYMDGMICLTIDEYAPNTNCMASMSTIKESYTKTNYKNHAS